MGDVLWALTDHQNTVRELVNHDDVTDESMVTNHIDYDAFGSIITEPHPSDGSVFAYTGREWDEDAGLYHYRERWYDAGSGRFITPDPVGFATGDANLYRYVGNDVGTQSDPSGLWPGGAQQPNPYSPDPRQRNPPSYHTARQSERLRELRTINKMVNRLKEHQRRLVKLHLAEINKLHGRVREGLMRLLEKERHDNKPIGVFTAGTNRRRTGYGPCTLYASLFERHYIPKRGAGVIVSYPIWNIIPRTKTAIAHQAVEITIVDTATNQTVGTIYYDAGDLGAMQGNLGGPNHIFFADDLPITYVPRK